MQYYSGRVVKPDQTKLGSTKPNTSYVCYLHKTLCGLKKAPRAWFHKLNTSLTTWGFESSCADTSLFFKHATSDVLILVYVDDILVTGSCASQVTFFISQLSSTFALRDLGSLYYFFGIGVTHSTDSLHLCQQKYVHDLLTDNQTDSTQTATRTAPHSVVTKQLCNPTKQLCNLSKPTLTDHCTEPINTGVNVILK